MKNLIVIFLLLMLAGCATTESLDQYYSEIDLKDGVNRNEAALIAKKWLTESKYEGDFQVIGPVVTTYEHFWQVSFLYKSLDYYEKVLDIYIDTATGEVKGSNIRPKGTPPITKEPWDTFNQNIKLPNNF
jgi:hypothetical protein